MQNIIMKFVWGSIFYLWVIYCIWFFCTVIADLSKGPINFIIKKYKISKN